MWTATGTYPPGAAHEGSHYQLHTSGPTVILHLTAVHAPVQHQARQQPTVLWQVPADLRPATPVTWEVEGWPVRADGTPDPNWPRPHRFTLQVDPDGAMRYVNNAQVDHVGYLRYTTTLVWPVAGAVPGVCTRSDEVRAAILAALSTTDGRHLPCERVTWAQLATIRTLGQVNEDLMRVAHARDLAQVAHPHDLVGLTGLEEAALRFAGTHWRPYLLLQAPRLQRLWLEAPYLEQMAMGLTGTLSLPVLTHLTVQAWSLRTLEPGWLPTLTALTNLAVRGDLRDLSSGWLPRLPLLTHLILHINRTGTNTVDRGWIREKFDLPPDWLPSLPSLTHLSLSNMGHMSPDWLPSLTYLFLNHTGGLPPDWALRLPSLTHLDVGSVPRQVPPPPNLTHLTLNRLWDPLPPDWALYLPALTHLELDGTGPERLPADWLPSLPALTHLTLDASGAAARFGRPDGYGWHREDILAPDTLGPLTTLPPDFLTAIPALTHLTLYAAGLTALPADLLVPVPGLTHLTLYADLLITLPSELLAPVPWLTHLFLDVDGLTTLPSLLASTSHLTHLTLYADSLTALPPDFLTAPPQLRHLALYTDRLVALPPDFLTVTPRLTVLVLWSSCLSALPPNFLRTSLPYIHSSALGR